VSPALGRGSTYEAELGRTMPVPPWLYSNLRRWHHLSFLRSPMTISGGSPLTPGGPAVGRANSHPTA